MSAGQPAQMLFFLRSGPLPVGHNRIAQNQINGLPGSGRHGREDPAQGLDVAQMIGRA